MKNYKLNLISRALSEHQSAETTVRDQAKAANISPSYLSNLVNLKTGKLPSDEVLRKLLGSAAEPLFAAFEIIDKPLATLLEEDLGISNPDQDPNLMRRAKALEEDLRKFLAEHRPIPQSALELLMADSEQLDDVTRFLGDRVSSTDDPQLITRIINRIQAPLDLETILDGDASAFETTFLLDPDNPRIAGRNSLPVGSDLNATVITRQKTQEECRKLLEKDSKTIFDSIRQGGYRRVNPIIVISLHGDGAPYIAVEGNTRTNAIYSVLADNTTSSFDLFHDVSIVELKGFSYPESKRLRHSIMMTIHMGGTKEWAPYKQGKVLYDNYVQLKQKGALSDKAIFEEIASYGRFTKNRIATDIHAFKDLTQAVETLKNDTSATYQLNPDSDIERLYSLFRELQSPRNKPARDFIHASADNAMRFYFWAGLATRIEVGSEENLDENGQIVDQPVDQYITLQVAPISGTHAIASFSELLERFPDGNEQRENLFRTMDNPDNHSVVHELLSSSKGLDLGTVKQKLDLASRSLNQVLSGLVDIGDVTELNEIANRMEKINRTTSVLTVSLNTLSNQLTKNDQQNP